LKSGIWPPDFLVWSWLVLIISPRAETQRRSVMLQRPNTDIVGVSPPQPTCLTGKYLSRNRLPPEARIAIALRLIRGGEPVSELTVAQVARAYAGCRAPKLIDSSDVIAAKPSALHSFARSASSKSGTCW
jgi:hypothetical protein